MKKMHLLAGFVLLSSVVFVSSSFTNLSKKKNLNEGVGNVITIDKGQTWYWFADNCSAPLVLASSARVQSATSGFVHITVTFQLPAGHCDIPAKGANVVHYTEDSWAVINSNGKVHAKIIYNPNGN